ncbi:MAG: hypothetical protein LC107_03295 [Chitinophagales bacterium]|nr:hypothetical protein [Chitinophagales bacterium]
MVQETQLKIKMKLILTMGFIVLAFSPCVVKGILSQTVDIAYVKPLNKTKSTFQNSSCQASLSMDLAFSYAKKVVIGQKALWDVVVDVIPVFRPSLIKHISRIQLFFDVSANAPPKYILFKRLKLAVA